MKNILLATSALSTTAAIASAQGAVTITGAAQMGILGGEWLVPNNLISAYDEFELLTDIDVTFTMSGQTDTGLTFGASIDLEESDGSGSGNDAEGASPAFDNRDQGGEEIFVSGSFGTLTMGDTDGALDWALVDIGLGESLGDAHTSHIGYIGNDFVDSQDGDGQIARYDRSFGDFAFAFSADIAEAGGKDILSAGAKYSIAFPIMRLGVGIGWQQREPHEFDEGKEKDAIGVSLDADFDNGFQIVANYVDLGDSPEGYLNKENNTVTELFKGFGIGYEMDKWSFAMNYSRITEEWPVYTAQNGYGIAVNYDMGGGAEFQMGFSESNCNPLGDNDTGGVVFNDAHQRCFNGRGGDDSAFSLGVKMNF